MNRLLVFAATCSLTLLRCSCANDYEAPCTLDSQCGPGGRCNAGKCSGGAGGGSIGTGGGAGGGTTVVTGCNPNAQGNLTRDTDCDGISDADEYSRDYGNGKHTDPCNADTDGDGIFDGVETGATASVATSCAGFKGDQHPKSHTNPTVGDTDGDGIGEGAEDKNHDGKVDPGESDATRIDSDCDGIGDADELAGKYGCVTDPIQRDSDQDGLPDGVEQSITAPGADAACAYAATVFDGDPSTKTSACNPDTDGDGIGDGAEDGDKNGRIDPGELNPNTSDGAGAAAQACATPNLKPVAFQSSGLADVNVALAPQFVEVGHLTDSNGAEKGLIFFNPATQVGGLVISRTPMGASVINDEASGRSTISSTAALSAPLNQSFTSWDGFGAIRAGYDQAGNVDLKTRLNDIAKAFLGGNVTGTLNGPAGVHGPFRLQVEFLRRAASRTVMVLAITPSTNITEAQLFTVDDTAGGSALAQFLDYTGTTCEQFDSKVGGKVDFVWVVDDSNSMETSQNAVGATGAAFGAKLANAGLDWRVGGVTSTQDRAFTTDPLVMQRWFTLNDPLWFSIYGSGLETFFPPVQSYVLKYPIRPDAALHVIALSDTMDQSNVADTTFTQFINGYSSNGRVSMMHGIICPEGQSCGDLGVTNPAKMHQVIRATGGVVGDITVANTTTPAAHAQLEGYISAIVSAAIGGAGYPLKRAPISASIKVAIEAGGTKGACNTSDVPRSRVDGFDFDAATRRIAFFGKCLPNQQNRKIAVSYRYWVENSADPAGDPCGATCAAPLACDPNTKSCVCPTNCGGTCTGATPSCDMATCSCSGVIN